MLGWIFKKTRNAPGQAAVAAQTIPLPDPSPSAASVDWAAKLTQADNDDAVLAVLRSADMPLQFKQAAVEALDGEAALRQAEREFRRFFLLTDPEARRVFF